MTSTADTSPDLSRTGARRLLLITVLLAAAVFVFPIWWGLPFAEPYTWAFDEVLPRQVVSPGSWDELYPPTHRRLLTPVLQATRAASRRGLSEMLGLDLLNTQMLAARSLTVVLACLTLVVFYLAARRVLDRKASLLAVASFAFGTNYVFYSKTANLDVPYVFWFALSVYFFLRCLESRRWHDYVLFAVCGTLAITTKSQAYALYFLAPFALVLDLRRNQPIDERSFWRALFDRRILEAAGATLATLFLVFGELWGSDELRSHIDAVTSRSYDAYRAHGAALSSLARITLGNLAFSLGLPVLIAVTAGLVQAFARPSRNKSLLQLLLFPASYYVGFILATGFNYDRHYLPVTLILGLFAGKSLGALVDATRPLFELRTAVAGLVIAYAVLRGLSVDLMLWGDARYEAERWLTDNDLYERTVGLGYRPVLPRGLIIFPHDRFATWTRGEHDTNPRVWHNCHVLNQIGVEYLIPLRPEQLNGPGVNYAEYRRFRNRAPFSVVSFGAYDPRSSNVVKTALDTVVFKRTDEQCVDAGLVARGLHELRFERDPKRRRSLATGLFESPASKARPLGSKDMYAVRLYPDDWTAGRQPAGVIIRNRGFRPHRPELGLDFGGLPVTAPPAERPDGGSSSDGRVVDPTADRGDGQPEFPVTVYVENGNRTRELVFEEPTSKIVKLASLKPGATRLLIVWTDRGFRDLEGTLRGVRLSSPPQPKSSRGRIGAPSPSFEDLSRTLEELAAGEGTVEREEFVGAILRGGVHEPVELDDEGTILVGGWHDGWTYGTRPAGILVQNPHSDSRRAQLSVSCTVPPAQPPAALSVENGTEETTHTLDCEGTTIWLDWLAPGTRRLYLLRSDRPSQPDEKGRPLGVLLEEVRLVRAAP